MKKISRQAYYIFIIINKRYSQTGAEQEGLHSQTSRAAEKLNESVCELL